MKRLFLLMIAAVTVNLSAFSQCTELYFSEYIEGSSNNKALEIYNPTGSSVDLSDYAVIRNNNGGTTNPDTFHMNGSLAAYGVYIIANSSADAAILAEADTTGSATFYNGDDALILANLATATNLDIIGVLGVDPGSSWTVGSGATANYTLVRKSTIKEGQSDWTTGATEWDVQPINTFSFLGSHTSDCYVPANPEVGFASTNIKANEMDGSLMVNVSIKNPSTTAGATVMVVITGGTATNGTEYTATTPTMLTFPMGSSADQSYSININDNAMSDIDKDIKLTLRDVTGADIGADSTATVTIENDDYLVSSIKGVRGNNANWTPEREGQKVEVTGIVYGIDLDGNAGYSFTIIDTSAGINVFSRSDVSDYVVTEGDEITVRGSILHYNGLTEVSPDSIMKKSDGNTLKTPMVVTKPTEDTESDFIEIRKIWITDTTTVWPSNGNVSVTNGTDTFLVRIDRDAIDIVGQPVVSDTMDITGIGGQFDGSAFPLDAGYQLFPRRLSDIVAWDKASVPAFTLSSAVYPNPSNGVVNVSAAQPIVKIEIIDALGNIVLTQEVVKEMHTSVALDNVSAGIYFVKINAENAASVKQLIVR